MAQESTFVRDIKSHAGAYGLMQMMPRTARQYARKLKLPLLAAAADDAGDRMSAWARCILPTRFASSAACIWRWPATTPARRRCAAGCARIPGLPQDEFIDSIPYPETQQYVKRLLGTAEDYRRLYGRSRPEGRHYAGKVGPHDLNPVAQADKV